MHGVASAAVAQDQEESFPAGTGAPSSVAAVRNEGMAPEEACRLAVSVHQGSHCMDY